MDDGRVTGLHLGDGGLRGELPPELGNLTELRELSLGGDNDLHGEIPNELSRLKRLEVLDFGSSGLNGAIPAWIGDFVHLWYLHLDDNNFVGEVPAELGNLIRLRSFTLNGNSGLSGPLPESLANISGLDRFEYHATDLCAPFESRFQDWLLDISDSNRSGNICPSPELIARLFDIKTKTCGLAPLTPQVTLPDIPRREHPMYVLTDIQRRWPALAKVVEEVAWVADGVDWSEKWKARNLFEGLHTIADLYGVQEALRVTKMPFFVALSPEESGAVYTLSNLIEDSPRKYRRLLDHPALKGGITDHLAKVIPMLDHVDTEDWDHVLQSASVEDRTIMLPLSGETNLTIVRIRPGLKSRMDELEYAVRLNECVMGIPFPHRQVTVLNVPTDAGGFYEVTYIGINESLDKEYDDLASLLVHEAAHAYFSADVDWIVEGAATFMQLVDGLLRPDTGYAITNRCADASSVSAFDRAVALDPDFTDKTACHYSLGAAVFWDLFRYLELEAFALGFRKLYLASKQVDDSEFVIVREAFGRSDAAELVLDLYYDGAVKFAQLRGDHAHPRGVPNVQRYISFLSVADGSSGYSPLVSIDEIPANADLRFSFDLYNEDLSEQGDVTQITESIDLIVYFEDGVELEQSEPEIYDFDLTYGRLEFVWRLGTPNGEALKPGSYYAYLYRDGKKIGQTWFHMLPTNALE